MTIGILLAGGKSSRFQQGDKALYFDDRLGKSWLELAYAKLDQLCEAVYISASPTNHEKIKQAMPGGQVQLDHSNYFGEGPLAALYSIAQNFPEEQRQDYLILSVDNPEVSVESLEKLMNKPNQYARDNFTIAHLSFSAEEIENYLASGQRRVLGFLDVLGASPLGLPDDELVNHNQA